MASKDSYLKNKGARNEKAVALLMSFLLHLIVGTVLFFVAPLFEKKDKLPEVYTVKLFFPEEKKTPTPKAPKSPPKTTKEKTKKSLKAKQKPKPKPEPKVKPKPKPKVKPKPKRKPPQKPKPVEKKTKPLSTKSVPPSKKRTTKKIDKETVKKIDEERLLRERIERLKRRVEEKREEEYLKKRLSEIKAKKKHKETTHISSRGSSGDSGENEVLRRYFTKIWEIIRSNWVLPQGLLDKKELEAVIVLTISKDGKILLSHFEKRSGEALFDQSAQRAIEAVDSFPPIPKELGQGPLEIGVRFKPED
ncbi:Ferric siderophore transport system, periplasmic binding protein TonB [Dissulfuribacter thermophilus]|uniref:Ferric siderophore transport system, periplasmic binding protein TonB n=1 Tax=Dissulfuribacter thermophilus TaxID=1156395 RepID=A0A1B9F3A9_9BACT|nr:energy transducer TonB [Dissulfuribacter thermophilus]OCC14410.1 Ferric siderophore transport system, periplasmic binding protein TonB [Dissulfuribacter thermophilus]